MASIEAFWAARLHEGFRRRSSVKSVPATIAALVEKEIKKTSEDL